MKLYILQKYTILLIILATFFGLKMCIASTHMHQPALELTLPSLEHEIIIPVTINQKTYNFMVDTGASVTVINEKIATTITHPIKFTDLPLNYQDDLQEIQTVSTSLNQLDIIFLQPITFFIGYQEISDNDLWLSQDLSSLTQAVGVDIDGLIGIDTFRKINWQIDNKKKRLVLSNDAPSASQYERCIGYEDSYNRAPLLYINHGDTEIGLYVDTGATRSYLGKDFIEFLSANNAMVQPILESSLSVDASGVNLTNEHIISELFFNEMPLGQMLVGENQNNMNSLGMNFFSHFERYAFIPSKMMFCYDGKSIEKNDLIPQRTIPIRYVHPHIEVFNDNKKLGLLAGDVILKVNGKAYRPEEIYQVRKMLSYTEPGKLCLNIRRSKKEKTICL